MKQNDGAGMNASGQQASRGLAADPGTGLHRRDSRKTYGIRGPLPSAGSVCCIFPAAGGKNFTISWPVVS